MQFDPIGDALSRIGTTLYKGSAPSSCSKTCVNGMDIPTSDLSSKYNVWAGTCLRLSRAGQAKGESDQMILFERNLQPV